jgi:hypothetical protein
MAFKSYVQNFQYNFGWFAVGRFDLSKKRSLDIATIYTYIYYIYIFNATFPSTLFLKFKLKSRHLYLGTVFNKSHYNYGT